MSKRLHTFINPSPEASFVRSKGEVEFSTIKLNCRPCWVSSMRTYPLAEEQRETCLKAFSIKVINNKGGISRNEKAFALAGLSNIVLKEAKGVQLAGLFNYAGEAKGFQLGGIANIAGDVTGFQFAGIVNKARNVSGVQFAGIVNIAQSSDYPIGLVNIIKDGEMGIALSYNEAGSTMLTFRSGGAVTYGIIGVGINHKESGSWYTTEAGFGAHINCCRWLKINNELKAASINNESVDPSFIASYSLLPAFRLIPHLELFGGPSINYMNAKNTENSNLLPKHSIWKKNSDSRLQRGYIGYQVGIQYLF